MHCIHLKFTYRIKDTQDFIKGHQVSSMRQAPSYIPNPKLLTQSLFSENSNWMGMERESPSSSVVAGDNSKPKKKEQTRTPGNKENVIFWSMQVDDTILILLLKLLSQQLSDVFDFRSFCSSWCLCVTGRKWGSQDMWSLLWGFSWPGSFHKYDFDPKLTNFHPVSWVEELWPPVLLELLATVCEDWSPRRQGQPEVSAGTSKHQTQGGWMIQHTLVSVHWRHASQWHLSAVRWRPGPVAALRVADDEASACTGSRHQMVPGSQLHLCCCCRGMRLLPQNQLREGGVPGELLLPLQGGVAPQPDLRPGTSPAPAIAG